MIQITIVDYGSGNVLSAQKSFIKVTNDNNINSKVLIFQKFENTQRYQKIKTLKLQTNINNMLRMQ